MWPIVLLLIPEGMRSHASGVQGKLFKRRAGGKFLMINTEILTQVILSSSESYVPDLSDGVEQATRDLDEKSRQALFPVKRFSLSRVVTWRNMTRASNQAAPAEINPAPKLIGLVPCLGSGSIAHDPVYQL